MSGSERFQPQHLTVLIALVKGSELLNEGKGAVAFKPLVSVVTKGKQKNQQTKWEFKIHFQHREAEHDC